MPLDQTIGRVFNFLFVGGILVCFALFGLQQWTKFFPKTTIEEEMEAESRRLRTALAAKVVAARTIDVDVVARTIDPSSGRPKTRFLWREKRLTSNGEPDGHYDALELDCLGTQPRFEALVMTFDDEEKTDLRGKSLVLFRRVYGEFTAPEDGYSFADPEDPVPAAYRSGGPKNAAERQLWSQLWNVATDPVLARRHDVAVVQTKAVAMNLIPGKRYRVEADSTGRIDIFGPMAIPESERSPLAPR